MKKFQLKIDEFNFLNRLALLTIFLSFLLYFGSFPRVAAPGDLDITFGNDGKVITPVGNESDLARDLAVQPDGKIVVVGVVNAFTSTGDFAVVRYNTNGALDTTFGNSGKVITPVSNTYYDDASAIAIQPNGKILVAGYSSINEFNEGQFALVRYNSNGSLDTTFDGDGKFVTVVGNESDAQSVIIQPDNKIVVAGYGTAAVGGNFSVALIRCNPNGSLDSTFGTGRKVNTSFSANTGAQAKAVTLQPDGKIVTAGNVISNNQNDFGVVRYLNDTFVSRHPLFDFDGDNKTDIGIFRPAPAEWWYQRSSDNDIFAVQFGQTTDKIVPADFTGDGKTEIAFWRESSGEWFILRSEDSSFYAFPFGSVGDIPAPGDFDADGKADAAVFRPSNAVWYLQRSTSGNTAIAFGSTGDQPIPNAFVR